MKVFLHRHHQSTELLNQLSVICHKESIQCPMQLQYGLQLRVRHRRASRKLQWQYTILLFRRLSLPIGSTEATVTVLDYGGHQKREADAITIDK